MTEPFSRSTDAWPETYTKSPALIAGLKGKTDFAPVVIILIIFSPFLNFFIKVTHPNLID
jgi:hypothetical protein